MKIIHTADWHIGQIFNEYDRTGEHLAFFSRLSDLVAQEKPDALLVSGDIFHNTIPSFSAQKLYTDAVIELKKACPSMTVVITAGNHDSGTRLEVDRNLWEHLGVKVIGGLTKQDGVPDIEKHIIGIPSRSEELAGYIIALPHIYRQNYPQPEDAPSDRQDAQAAFYRKLTDAVSQRNTSCLPVVMMAHLAVSGCNSAGHDRVVGGMDYTPAETFGTGADYIALGHIHHPQTLNTPPGAPIVRYSGSPIPVSFDEDYAHSVTLVEILPGKTKKIDIRTIDIPVSIPVLTLPADPVPLGQALEAFGHFPDNRLAYIRLNVSVTDFLPPDAAIRAAKVAEGKKCRYCYIKVTRNPEDNSKDDSPSGIGGIREMSPAEVAEIYYRKTFHAEMDERLKTMFSETEDEEKQYGK